ncbi:MAG: hypothetical protein AABX34_06575 [Nanoarchaeota archaeon]
MQSKKIKSEEGDYYLIANKKKESLSNLFGRGKHLNVDAQKAKDELREEWE